MGKISTFIKEFFVNTSTVGSLFPSSPFLTGKMLENIDFSKDLIILELGAGTGVFTNSLLKKSSKNSRLIVFENNEAFFPKLKERFQYDARIELVFANAETFKEKLEELNIFHVDVIISSLPLMNLPDKVGQIVIEKSLSSLKQDGMFIQYQYSLEAKEMLYSKFNRVEMTFTALNIPPAFIYTCFLH